MSNNKYFLQVAVLVLFASIATDLYLSEQGILSFTNDNSAAAVQSLGDDSPGHPAFPSVALARPTHGPDAIAALGDKLPEVARWYGMTDDELRSTFIQDKTLFADKKGKLFYADNDTITANVQNGAVASGDPLSPSGGLLPLEQTFFLHSRPSSTKVIFLDFDGNTTTGTSWNSSYTSGAAIVSAPFSLDSDPTTFNSSELSMIQRIWQRVAEDYAPFDVDVTTQDPGLEGLRRTSTSDTAYGQHVVISPTNWYSTSAGGVSYIGSFNFNSDTPNFVFTQQLANGEKYIAEAASHETGHSVGLSHDGLGGTTPTTYYSGQGVWAPIMGNSYYRAVTQFSKGEYANANNKQDDLTIIAGYLGYSADDYGNTTSTASPVTVSGNNISAAGFIEKTGDVDFFSFNSAAGSATFNVNVATIAPDLDVMMDLYDSTGKLLVSVDPTGLSASTTVSLAGGTYYISITGVGSGDPVTTGYSNYASIGQYYLTGTINGTGVNNPPVAVISATPASGGIPLAVQFSSTGSSDPEGTALTYLWNFGDNTTSSVANPSKTYALPGTYTATLTVKDASGLSNMKSITISAINQSPVASFTISGTSYDIPATVNVDASASSDPDGTIVSYLWNFGDGTTATGVTASHTYATPGSFPISLTVVDNNGASTTKTVSVTTVDPNAIAAPSNLTGSAPGGMKSTAVLNWTDNSGNETSFYVERAASVRQGTLIYQRVATVGPNVASYTDSVPSGTYYYRVQSYSSTLGKTSAYSNAVSVRVK
jgi:PKD repeat protein